VVTGGLARDLSIEIVSIAQLRPYRRNARQHSKRQISQIAKSIEFGLNNPVLIDEAGQIMARVAAATQLGLCEVPVVRLSHMTDVQKWEERRSERQAIPREPIGGDSR